MRCKKTYLPVVVVLLLLVLLTSCVEKERISQPTPQGNKISAEKRDLRSYCPTTRGMIYHFTSQGTKYGAFTREIQFTEENRVLLAENNGAVSTVYVYQVSADQITRFLNVMDSGNKKNFKTSIPKGKTDEEIILKNPIRAGISWESGEWRREISGTDETIIVPAGTFYHVIKVKLMQKKSKRPSENYEYYAPNVGLIMREYNNEGTKIIGKLASYGMKTAAIQPQTTTAAAVILDKPNFALLAYHLENELRSVSRSAYQSYLNLNKITQSNQVNFEQIITVYRASMENIAVKDVIAEQVKRLRDYFTVGQGEALFPDREVVEGVKVNQESALHGEVTLTIHKYFPATGTDGDNGYDTISDFTIELIKIDGIWKIEKVNQAE